MPLYDYKCSNATISTRRARVLTRRRGSPARPAASEAKRVLHPPPIVFKGSGFYITDSRKGSQATLAEKSRWDTSGQARRLRLQILDARHGLKAGAGRVPQRRRLRQTKQPQVRDGPLGDGAKAASLRLGHCEESADDAAISRMIEAFSRRS